MFSGFAKNKGGPFLTEINLVYLEEQKLHAISFGKKMF
jgi:hypothetical protein